VKMTTKKLYLFAKSVDGLYHGRLFKACCADTRYRNITILTNSLLKEHDRPEKLTRACRCAVWTITVLFIPQFQIDIAYVDIGHGHQGSCAAPAGCRDACM